MLCEGELVIGSSSYCSLVVEHESVSRVHATLRLDSAGLILKDEESRNGTFVNDERVHGSRPVRPGDRIVLGKMLIVVENEWERTSFPTGQMPRVPSAFDTGVTHDGGNKE